MGIDSHTWTVREYVKGDSLMVSQWWADHDQGMFPEALLPPVGIVVEHGGEPIAAIWLYMAVGIGVCWLEYPVSRPGISLKDSTVAFGLAIRALEKVAKTHDYGVMLAHTLPGIARVMRSFGFRSENRKKVTVLKSLWE
jgi:hypothetical protein